MTDDELLVQKVILAISSASVPHPGPYVGSLETRSLAYYLGVGIDHFGHDYRRHDVLLTRAAEQAIAMVRDSDRSGEAGETPLGGSTVGESAGRNGIAQTSPEQSA